MYENIKDAITKYYEESLARYQVGPRSVNWRDEKSQRLRFKMLSQIGDLSGKVVHEVGCGLAHYYDYLQEQNTDCVYVGSDISPKMIEAAKRRLGRSVDLYIADILEENERSWMMADYVVNSGVFTVKGSIASSEWRAFVEAMILRMYELCRVGIAFNLMTTYVDYRDEHLYYQSPQETLDYCINKLSRKVVIRHDYPLWEYMTYVYK